MRTAVLISVVRLLALLAYPLLVVAAWWLDQPALRALGMPLLVIALAWPWTGRAGGWVLLGASLILAALVITWPHLALWPPGLLALTAAAAFGWSLKRPRVPLIERYARTLHAPEPLPAGAAGWLRAWTRTWTLALGVLGAVAVILAAGGWPGPWLIWVALVMPVAMLTLLVTEFTLRRRRFADAATLTLAGFFAGLIQARAEHGVR